MVCSSSQPCESRRSTRMISGPSGSARRFSSAAAIRGAVKYWFSMYSVFFAAAIMSR